MGSAQQLIEYQRKCYEADNRETGISSLLHAKIRHLKFLDGEEVIVHGTLPRVPLARKYATALQKDAYQYRRDKSLVYAPFPIVGQGEMYPGLPARICAPLIFLNADFEEIHGSLFLVPRIDEVRINFPALALIAEATGADAPRLEQTLADLPPLPWPRDRLHAIAATLAELLPEVDFTPLGSFPRLLAANAVHTHFHPPSNSNGEQDTSPSVVCESTDSVYAVNRRADPTATPTSSSLACLLATAIALLPNSPETRGVLFELSQLSNSPELSQPLRCLLRQEFSKHTGKPFTRLTAPVTPSVLSNAQRRALHAGASYPLTLVVGPPGTGKSHTIASIALDHLSRNQSVLIASRMDQAVDVVANKIDTLLGPTNAIVRAGRKAHLRELKSRLEDMLSGLGAGYSEASDEAKSRGHSDARRLRRELRKLDQSIAQREVRIENGIHHEVAWGALEELPSLGFFGGLSNSLAKKYRNWRLNGVDLWSDFQSYESLLDSRQAVSRRYLNSVLRERISRMLGRNRGDLTKFLTALRARSDGKQQRLFDEIDFSVLLHAFPVWLCKLSDLSNVLPMRQALFDVVILDEATQCDIASCLPLLFRARRAVVVGDPKQLRHISFLPESRQVASARECELTATQQIQYHYRDKSILDAVSDSIVDQEHVSFLNEHFRSLPDIIRFSKTEFYSDSLAVMREQPRTADLRCVQIRRTNGQRSTNGVNQVEADQLVTDLLEHIAANSTESAQTIGVLSPFRDQVDYLSKALEKNLSFDQMRRHDLLIGTAHTFQGEERDVMWLSLAIDGDAHSATVRFINTPQLLNVAITRARQLQFVYASFDHHKHDRKSLLAQYLQSVETPPAMANPPNSIVDGFRQGVVAELVRLGLKVWQDYRVASEPMDLIVESQGGMLALDLIGYPGQLSGAYSLERYRMLQRAGLRVLPLCYRDWKLRQPQVLQRITALLRLEA
jgi:hypothetical protein